MIDQYLIYGCCNEFPDTNLPEETSLDYNSTVNTLRDLIDKSMPEIDKDNTILQLSGGFDSSMVASYYNNIKSFCTGEENSLDKMYSEKISKEFNTWHRWMSHEEMLGKINFKETIIEMAQINRYPRCFKNDFGLFAFLKYIREYATNVISGKGIEFQLLGYCTIYNKIVEHSIGIREYSTDKAIEYVKAGIDSPKDMVPLDMMSIISSTRQSKKYSLDMVNFWGGAFGRDEVERLTGNKQKEVTFNTIREIIDFIFEWFGREYIDNRLEDYGKYFGVNCITPYIDVKVVDFIKTIPVELKKCMNHHKYIFYQAMAHKLPSYIIDRPKEGLNTSIDYFYSNLEDIQVLIEDYLMDKTMKIYNYIDYEEVDLNFDKLWSLLNLSIWMEHNDTSN